MAYVYSSGELYPSNKPCYVDVGENEVFTVYENPTNGMVSKKIFSGSSYSGEFNLSSVVDVRYDMGNVMFQDINDSSYGGLTKTYTVETSDGTKTDYRFFYSPFGGNYTTTDRTFISNYEPIIYTGTYTWTLRLNADGLSSLTCNFANPQNGETRVDRCGEWWVLYFLDERGLPSFIYLNGKTTEYETRTGELSIVRKPYQDVDAEEEFQKTVYQKLSLKKFECNTGFLSGDKFTAMEHVLKSPDYFLARMVGSVMYDSYRVILTSSQLQTSPNARLNQNNFKLTFESIYENVIR